MIRIALLIFVLLGGFAMAKDGAGLLGPTDTFDPQKQIIGPDGKSRRPEDGPSQAEMGMWMWQRFAGDKPMPNRLRRKYGIPEDPNAPERY